MSLCCHECKRDIEYGTPLRMVTRLGNDAYSAVCEQCLTPCPGSAHIHEGSLVVCEGSSGKNIIGGVFDTGNYSWTGMQLGKQLYGIDESQARLHLPATASDYFGGDLDSPKGIIVPKEDGK